MLCFLQHFNVPYVFKIFRWAGTGVAITQYKLFTTHKTYLPTIPPKLPTFAKEDSESQEQFKLRCYQFLNTQQGNIFITSLSETFGGSKAICDRYGVPEVYAAYQGCSPEELKRREALEKASPVFEKLMKKVAEEFSKGFGEFEGWTFDTYGHHNLANLPFKTTENREKLRAVSIETGGFLCMLVPRVELKPAQEAKLPPGIKQWPMLDLYPWVPRPPVSQPDNPIVKAAVRERFESGFKHIVKVAKSVLASLEGESPVFALMPAGSQHFSYSTARPYQLNRDLELPYYQLRANEARFIAHMQEVWDDAEDWCVIPHEIIIHGRPKYGFEDAVAKQLYARTVANAVEKAGGNQKNHSIPENTELLTRTGLLQTCVTVKEGVHPVGRDGAVPPPLPLPKQPAASKQKNTNQQPAAAVNSSSSSSSNSKFIDYFFICLLSVEYFLFTCFAAASLVPLTSASGKKRGPKPGAKAIKAAATLQLSKLDQRIAQVIHDINLPLPSLTPAVTTATVEKLPPSKRTRIDLAASASHQHVCNVIECEGEAKFECTNLACTQVVWCHLHKLHRQHMNMQFRMPLVQTNESGFFDLPLQPQVSYYD